MGCRHCRSQAEGPRRAGTRPAPTGGMRGMGRGDAGEVCEGRHQGEERGDRSEERVTEVGAPCGCPPSPAGSPASDIPQPPIRETAILPAPPGRRTSHIQSPESSKITFQTMSPSKSPALPGTGACPVPSPLRCLLAVKRRASGTQFAAAKGPGFASMEPRLLSRGYFSTREP